jgi:hypothetical protein
MRGTVSKRLRKAVATTCPYDLTKAQFLKVLKNAWYKLSHAEKRLARG